MASVLGGRLPADHRRVLDGILWIARTGAPWHDMPAELGNWNSVWWQFRRGPPWDWLLQALADAGGQADALQMTDSTIIRAHHCATGAKVETYGQALGRSRDGFSTKTHLRANADGLAIGAVLTPGEAHDVTAYAALVAERDSEPGVLLANKGYDSDVTRQNARDCGAAPEIPTKRNRKVQHSVDKPLYTLRARIECFIGRLKNYRRIATRYGQTRTSFLGFVPLESIRGWTRFVHAT